MSFILTDSLSSIEDILEDARQGKMFILVDGESRENEGDLVIPAQFSTPESINFMATYGRGLICLALTADRRRDLCLPMMSHLNQSRLGTAFTVSIEAREGITTGISAFDRSRTISVAIDPKKGRDDLVTPGHVFPLVAREGGVLARAGHTEAAVDIARLAGLTPAGVICEIMNDDGSMARLPDLVIFARRHGLKISTVEKLIAWRRRTERLVRCCFEGPFVSEWGGEWTLKVYVNAIDNVEHLVLLKGSVSSGNMPLVWIHRLNILDDVFGGSQGSYTGSVRAAMECIGREEHGIIVLLRHPNTAALTEHVVCGAGDETLCGEHIDYVVGAQILLDLSVHDIILLSNSESLSAELDVCGLRINERRSLFGG